jgi:hypothetical protein
MDFISSLVVGDFNEIIYGKGEHVLLKIHQDSSIDNQRDD